MAESEHVRRHTLSSALEQLRTRLASGWPSLDSARELDKLLDAVRFDATPEQLDKPFSQCPPAPPREVAACREAYAEATRCMVPPSIGGLGFTSWEDVGGLTRLEVVGLLTLALQVFDGPGGGEPAWYVPRSRTMPPAAQLDRAADS